MVQNVEQYQFIHDAIQETLTQNSLLIDITPMSVDAVLQELEEVRVHQVPLHKDKTLDLVLSTFP